jgi:23S rRNA (uracil1939-C5)-methyltransferase
MIPCRHFGVCGGCVSQDQPEIAYHQGKRHIVSEALARHGVAAEVEEVVAVAPASRRRATLKAKLADGRLELGFHAARTHDIVDLEECLVLVPALTGLLPGLRTMLAELLAPAGDAELKLTATSTGVDLGLRWRRRNDPPTLVALARWAEALNIARISAHGETVVQRERPLVHFGKATVALPPEVFLQPTEEGEAVLQRFVCEALSGAKKLVDLFCGCGTLTFPLAAKARVHAVEFEAPMLEALAAAAKATPGLKPVTVEKRNLFKRPLTPAELSPFDGACLDPPRAGALEQCKSLARSKIGRIAYVSCDAESFARDARVLVDSGFRLTRVLPVDQFLWSSHIEVVGGLERS